MTDVFQFESIQLAHRIQSMLSMEGDTLSIFFISLVYASLFIYFPQLFVTHRTIL